MGVRGVVGPCKPKAVVAYLSSYCDGWRTVRIAYCGDGGGTGYFVHVADDEDVAPGRSLVAS